MADTVLIVDISHLTYRAESSPGDTLYTSTNLPTKALYGILTSINKILNEKPNINKIYLAFDGFSKYRRELYPEYKANREHNPEDKRYAAYIEPDDHGWSRKDRIKFTIDKIKEIAPSLAMHVAYDKDSEGDDMGYRLGKQLYYNSDLIFMTDDKDWLQLINLFPKATVYRAMANEIITEKNFLQTQGVPPAWFVIQKAMLGDKSDNITSVLSGCGEKAIELLLSEAIKKNINPESESLWIQLQDVVRDLESNNKLGRHKNLTKIYDYENYQTFNRNIKLVDFRKCPADNVLTENLNEILHLDFEKAVDIIKTLEFRSLNKIVVPGSPWCKLS